MGVNYTTWYAYDGLSNLKTVTQGAQTRTFAYDGLSRLTSATNPESGTVSYTYDNNGNLLTKTDARGTMANAYDAENRVMTETDGTVTTYGYDSEGRRVQKAVSGTPPCTTCYLSYDHLGSVRLVTDQNAKVVARHDYMPFGGEIPGNTVGRDSSFGATDNVSQRFTGKERDQESGLDYLGARYYGSALGRFTSPDDPLVDQHASDPQSWNLYSYVRNNPLKNTDPNGLDCITTSNQTSSGVEVTTERGGSAETCSGTYVNGTVDVNSYSYNGGSLGYSFSNDTSAGAGTISFGSSQSNDEWGPGSSNMLGAAQIGRTATVGNILGGALIGGGVVAGGGIAYGAWAGGSALTALTIPAATLPPTVSNPTLQSIVQKLFQETDVLPGGTAGAVRYELATGELMSPSGHSMKAQEVITALTNLLKSGKLSFNDQIVSRQLIQDLSDALKTQPRR